MDTGSWVAALERAGEELSQALIDYLPRIAVAVAIVLAGWVVARILRWSTRRLTVKIGGVRAGRAVEAAVRSSGAARVASEVVGGIVFWTVLVFFVTMAAETVGLAVTTSTLAVVVREYLPSVLAAAIIVLAGMVLSRVARDTVASLFTSSGVSGRVPGELARYTVVLLCAVVALDQIGIDSTLLILAVGIVLAAVVGSAALAVGLGAREEVGNIIALHYLSRSYHVGQRVRIGDVEGRILEFRMNGVVVDSAEGRTLVPAAEFSRQASCLLGQA